MFFIVNSRLSWVIKSIIQGSLIITTNKNVIHIYKKNNGDITCMINEQRRVGLGIIECVSKYWIFDIYIYILKGEKLFWNNLAHIMLIIFLNRVDLKFGQMDVLYFSYTMAYMAMVKK